MGTFGTALPNARCFTKLQIANGKWQIKGLRRNYISFARERINLLIKKSFKGGVPLFEEGKEHDRRRWRKQGV